MTCSLVGFSAEEDELSCLVGLIGSQECGCCYHHEEKRVRLPLRYRVGIP